MIRYAMAGALVLALSGCVATESGVRSPARFQDIAERTQIDSALSPAAVARCFEDHAALLPMTAFVPTHEGPGVLYRLGGFGFSFEEIEFAPSADGGSAITIKLAPGVNARWRRNFERDRFAVVSRCAARQPGLE
jgi:hypothetical protein